MASEKSVLRVGTRESQLAKWQTAFIVSEMEKHNPSLQFEVIGISTKGDKVLDTPLAKIGDKGLFTKELEVALADGRVDMVVHSLKDLPSTMPPGMLIGCISARADRRDALVMSEQHRGKHSLAELPANAVVGTSSLRRIAQLSASHGHLRCEDVRGNLNTRLRKLDADDGKYDALVLAAAGLDRLDWGERVSARFSPEEVMYAAGQGALAVEVRENDDSALKIVQGLMDRCTMAECVAERSFLRALGGGCSVPIGVNCSFEAVTGGSCKMQLAGAVFSLDGKTVLRDDSTADTSTSCDQSSNVLVGVHVPEKWLRDGGMAASLGERVANSLLAQGAGPMLDTIREAIAPGKP